MSDLEQRFRAADDIDVADRWSEIQRREPRHGPVSAPSRWLTMAVGSLVGLAVITLVLLALRQREASRPQPQAAADLGNGLIAVSGGPYGGPQIILMNPDGTDAHAITAGGERMGTPEHPFPAWEPAWSPDGTRIAFRGYWNDSEVSDLFVMRADGSDLRQLTTGQNTSKPAWSPDGSMIAYGGVNGLYTISQDGSGTHRITPDPVHFADDPAWSPDGSTIAFVGLDGGTPQIFRIDIDGSDMTQLTHIPTGSSGPSWSPDGSRIAFVKTADHSDIFMMSAAGSHVERLTRCEPDLCNSDTSPTWSPDGTLVLFSHGLNGNRTVLATVRADGTGFQQVTAVPGAYLDPSWQPVPLSP